MKTIQRAIRLLACGLGAVAIAPTAGAEAQAGFYVGASAGESSFDIEQSDFDGVVLDVFFSQGVPVLSASSKFEDSDTAFSVFGGYRFNPYIAVEGSYVDFGAAEYRAIGTVNPPGPAVSAPASVDLDVESKGLTVAGLASLPLGDFVDLHGRLGFMFADTDLSVRVSIANGRGTDSESLESTSVYFGLGAGFHLGEHWSLSVDWTRYDNVGDEDEDDDLDTEAGFDIDAVTFAAMFRF